ncbi:helix-turn-helix domain-containing protein [Marinivivus vitaminiproducens]|uniref:helix-turn-helix domain-containing protein n=1 Tax=Marinivivus vitaminiproducens TaxID=3035935 RepID=UPI00279D0F1A|nr:helix-turn-helix domain-containing protein [Geminicoccaceae bacterium SCSIO 64248]
MPHGELARLAALATIKRFKPGQFLAEEGEPADAVFNVIRGTVRLYKLLPDGRRQITGFADAADFLGLAAGHTYAFTIEAIDSVQACTFVRTRFRSLIEDLPALEHRLLELASAELEAAQYQMLLLGRKSACERVATFLCIRHKIGLRSADPGCRTVLLPMSRTDIADYLGLTIETVSRTLTKLRKNELITLQPHKRGVIINDLDALWALAEGCADGS